MIDSLVRCLVPDYFWNCFHRLSQVFIAQVITPLFSSVWLPSSFGVNSFTLSVSVKVSIFFWVFCQQLTLTCCQKFQIFFELYANGSLSLAVKEALDLGLRHLCKFFFQPGKHRSTVGRMMQKQKGQTGRNKYKKKRKLAESSRQVSVSFHTYLWTDVFSKLFDASPPIRVPRTTRPNDG